MNAYRTHTLRPFYRSADRAVLGGVCAGVADYFGFNLRVLRFLTVIAFIFAMPMAVIAYLAIVLLVPARAGSRYDRAGGGHERVSRKERRARRKERKCERRRAREEAGWHAQESMVAAADEVRDKCQALDKRLADLEKHITSSQYQLDREIRNL